jgi:hypothetical protein
MTTVAVGRRASFGVSEGPETNRNALPGPTYMPEYQQIGSTFRIVGVRYELVGVGLSLLVFAVVLILQQPAPPS